MKFEFDGFTFQMDKGCVNDALLIVVSGSHAYGWNTPQSDLDVRRVFFPDIQQALSVFYGCRTKEHKHKYERGLVETTDYPIQAFLRLLAKGNGNALDNLFEATGPPDPKLHVDTVKVKQLQKIVLSHLHLGFLMHCTGYDIHLKKDLENERRLIQYGEVKLLLNRYKILLEGLILANYGEVVYNLKKQHEYIKTNWCIELLDTYQAGQPFLGLRANQEVFREVEQLHGRLAATIQTIKWPAQHQSTIDLALDKWLIEHYVPQSKQK